MPFTEFLPPAEWRAHIAAFWLRQSAPDANPVGRRVYADGCADLIYNAGSGTAPKEFLKIIRFQEALKRLQLNTSQESLLRIAYELGYYDHAHLTNEFKKYAGILPSELSFFYKTGISDGQYF